ncbi:hypothetical protein ACI797_15355 [Geodermatophilus sp. SYSU D00691]
MKRAALVTATVATGMSLLSACGGSGDANAEGATPTSSLAPYTPGENVQRGLDAERSAAASSSATGPELNQRGNLVKQLGEIGGVSSTQGGPLMVTFSVDAIRVDPPCDAPAASEPLNGHFIAVDLHVTTDPALTDHVFLAEKDFAIVGPNGVTDTNVVGYGWTCLRNRFPDNPLGPGQEYVGSIVLDTAQTSGALIFEPNLGQDGGWEWTF